MANQTNTTDNREIDLGHVSRKMRGYISRVNDSFFDMILFAKKYWIVLILLIAAGVVLGMRSEGATRYEHQIIVQPNFGSIDYLYEEVSMITNKLRQRDTVFLQSTGINTSGKLTKVEAEPIVDIFSFMSDPAASKEDNDRKYQLFRIIAEGGDIEKTVEYGMTSRNYKYHLLTLSTREPATKEEIVDPLLNYLDSNPYYKKMKKEYTNNLNLKIAANDTMIKQIDKILNDFTRNAGGGAGVVLQDNTALNDVIEMKNDLTLEQGRNRLDKVDFKSVIAERGFTMNNKVYSVFSSLLKFIYPILFVLLFAGIIQFRHYYRKQVAKRKIVTANE